MNFSFTPRRAAFTSPEVARFFRKSHEATTGAGIVEASKKLIIKNLHAPRRPACVSLATKSESVKNCTIPLKPFCFCYAVHK
jgi:hypothetical protein